MARWLIAWFSLGFFLAPLTAARAEAPLRLPGSYVADIVTSQEGQKRPSRLYFNHGLMRVEPDEKTVILVRPDQKKFITVQLIEKSYYEIPLTDAQEAIYDPAVFAKPDQSKWDAAGADKIDNRDVNKFEVTTSTEGIPPKTTWYLDKETGSPVRITLPEGIVVDWSVREGVQPTALFEVPRDFKKIEAPVEAPPGN